ncbi:MAG: 6-phosphogluconolactonase [Actinomycetota bacterium]|jgi:6-phosphogluconolactonase (cycloisomerase 2 family)|nr:6-phosphogluconolactonase [Actinomycetota bacterium]
MTGLTRRTFLGAVGVAGIGTALGSTVATASTTECYAEEGAIFISSYTSSPPVGNGLDVAHRTGSVLVRDRTIPGITDASWFDVSSDRKTLYVTNETTSGTVSALSLADPAKPALLNTKSSGGAAPTHLSVHPSQKYVLAANYSTGTVVVLPILAGGKLGDRTDLVQHVGAERDAHAHQVVTDPSGQWVLSVDLGADSVYVYKLDLATGKLKLQHQVRLPSGAGPRHLAFHPAGRYAYIVGELRAEVTVASWDAALGKLTPVKVVSAIPAGSTGDQYPGEITVSADGRFAYATVRGPNTIATFSVTDGGASVTRLSNVATGGNWPRHLTVDPTGRWFYVSNQRSGTVTWLPRDAATGLPGAVAGSLAIPSVNSVRFL